MSRTSLEDAFGLKALTIHSPQARRMLSVLLLLYIASMLDRQVIGLLIPQIKTSLGISDVAVSLVTGLAFALFYCVAGLPLGYLVDRFPRRRIIFVGVIVWGVATAGCGLATSYGELALARFIVGAGEAVLAPAAYSLLADGFARGRLGLAISIFAIGATVGSGAAFLFGGLILASLPPAGITTPIGHFAIWQATFVTAALPALLFAPLVFTFREPARRQMLATGPRPGVANTVRFVKDRNGFFLPFFAGNGFLLLCAYGFTAWVPTYLTRHYAITMANASLMLAFAALVGVPIGMIAIGALVDRLFVRGVTDAHMRVFAGIGIAYAIVGFFVPLAPTPRIALIPIFLLYMLSGIGALAAAIPLTTPNDYRGQVSALYLLVANLLGIGVGPTAVALLTDNLFHNDMMVGWSISIILMIGGPSAALLFLVARRPMRDAVRLAEAW